LDSLPRAILLVADHEFFVEEAAEEARARYEREGYEVERIEEEDLGSRLAPALFQESLFSSLRLVDADLTALLRRPTAPELVDEALENWAKATPAGRRQAFRNARLLASSLKLDSTDPEAAALAAAKKAKRPESIETLAEIFRELPPSRGGTADAHADVTAFLECEVPGVVLLARAVAPTRGSDLAKAFAKRGEVRNVSADEGGQGRLLVARARRLAAQRGRSLASGAAEELLRLTGGDPRLFASELDRVLEWAADKPVSKADIVALVDDRNPEDVYDFFDAFGQRKREEAMACLTRILSGKALKAGNWDLKGEDPLRSFFGMFVSEIRRLLTVRAACEELGIRIDPALSSPAYEARVHPRLAQAAGLEGKVYPWYKSYLNAGRFSVAELTRSLIACAEGDAAVRNYGEEDGSGPNRLDDVLAALVAGAL
jgi:DNA polymerase III delta subunit